MISVKGLHQVGSKCNILLLEITIISFKINTCILQAYITPGPVTIVQSKATQSSIKIMWTAPTTASGQEMCIDHYFVQYSFGSEPAVKETVETEFELVNLAPCTFALFTIRTECQGRLGPDVLIGQSTGNHCI